MRLLRVRVEHVRGLDAAEVVFDPDGVTVVEAPNESGKTTLLDAVDLVLTHKDRTRKQEVRELQPVGRDVGSTIEVELTCGSTHLTVRKRFNKDRMTELVVHAPTRRELTGDEAHDELRRTLDAATDLPLYDALRFRQGRSLDSVALDSSGSLAARLDEIAGGSGDAGDDVLLARVRAEYERYFTPSGQDGQTLRTAAADVAAAQAHVDDLRARARAIDDDVERLVQLERDHRTLAATLAELEPALVEHRRVSERVRSLREELRTREARAEVADGQLERARRDVAEREELVHRVDTLARAVDERAPAVAASREQLEVHAGRLEQADVEVEAAEAREHDARVALDAARAAADLGRRRDELRALRGRQQRIDEAFTAAADAEAALAAGCVTPDQVGAIRSAADQVRLAAARLDDAAPTVVVRALDAIAVTVDGDEVPLAPGDRLERAVPDVSRMQVADLVEVEVRAGSSLQDRQADVDAARRAVEDACRIAGVADPEAAERSLAGRRTHERAVEDRDAIIARELAGWSREQLADRIRTAQAGLRELEARLEEAADQAGPATDAQLAFTVDGDVAAQQLTEVEARDIAARDAAEQARGERSGLEHQVERLRGELRVTSADLAARQRELEQEQRRLVAARDRISDDRLDAEVRDAQRIVDEAHRAIVTARRELDALGADRVEMLAVNAERRASRARDDLARVRDELTELRARVEVRGGEGVGEALQLATAELERAQQLAARRRRRADAAAQLKHAFERARDDAYAAYREPLRERIVRAGRVVFGDSLDVELDDELRIVARHLDGTTLPWDGLSAGAREQLAILAAVAAADLAGRGSDGGVPLVLDDTLGYTDAARLERLCAVLARVRGPQIIVLTCVGERFRAIGGATVVRLADRENRSDSTAVA